MIFLYRLYCRYLLCKMVLLLLFFQLIGLSLQPKNLSIHYYARQKYQKSSEGARHQHKRNFLSIGCAS